ATLLSARRGEDLGIRARLLARVLARSAGASWARGRLLVGAQGRGGAFLVSGAWSARGEVQAPSGLRVPPRLRGRAVDRQGWWARLATTGQVVGFVSAAPARVRPSGDPLRT